MRIYLDASALVKLVQLEAESAALRNYLRRHRSEERLSSALSRVEVVRAVSRAGPEAITRARSVLARLHLVPMDRHLLDVAAELGPPVLRSLDAIHIASAHLLRAELRAVVTYDARMAAATRALRLPVAAPE